MLSRVADSLYWMSRYLERAEHTARLVDVEMQLWLDQAPSEGGGALALSDGGVAHGPAEKVRRSPVEPRAPRK